MSSIVTAVFKATIGLLVNKARDEAVRQLKDGDVTEEKLRELIVRDITDIRSQLDGLARQSLLASINFFDVGIGILYDKARSSSERSASTTQAACDEPFSLAKIMKKLEFIVLDKSATRALSDAKDRFRDSRREATKAFSNKALETSDRILAMQYRVMATILEKLDNPEDAIAPCRVCVEQLNSLAAVKSCFDVQLNEGLGGVRGWFGRDQREQIICSVYRVNDVVYDVTQTVSKGVDPRIWPTVDVGKDKVNPLLDQRLTEVLRRHGIEQCYVTLSFGQGGEEEHKLKEPVCIATNSSGHFIIGDKKDCTVKVFDSGGKFVKHFSVCSDVLDTKFYIHDVATDVNDNIYVLVILIKLWPDPYERALVHRFENNTSLHHKFPLREGGLPRHNYRKGNRTYGVVVNSSVIVTDSGKVLVLNTADVVDVYKNDGQFVRSFGKGILNDANNITPANDGRVMVVDRLVSFVHIFSEDGDHLNGFKLQGCYHFPVITFHQGRENVVVASTNPVRKHLQIAIYSKDGEFVRSTHIHQEGINYVTGITVTLEGRIALLLDYIRVIEVRRKFAV